MYIHGQASQGIQETNSTMKNEQTWILRQFSNYIPREKINMASIVLTMQIGASFMVTAINKGSLDILVVSFVMNEREYRQYSVKLCFIYKENLLHS